MDGKPCLQFNTHMVTFYQQTYGELTPFFQALKECKLLGSKCEKCGQPMALKRSRYGTFYGCTGYPDCKNIRKTGPAAAPPKGTGVSCPECKEGHLRYAPANARFMTRTAGISRSRPITAMKSPRVE